MASEPSDVARHWPSWGAIYDWLEDRFRGLDYSWRVAISNPSPEPTSEGSPQPTPKERREKLENWADDGFPPDERPDPLLVLRADGVSDTVVGRVWLTDTVIEDPSDRRARAHAKMLVQRQRIDGDVETERWLLGEAWWAETFAPPHFSELARWGLRIIPWALNNHLGTSFRRAWTQSPEQTKRSGWRKQLRRCVFWLLWCLGVVAAALGFGRDPGDAIAPCRAQYPPPRKPGAYIDEGTRC